MDVNLGSDFGLVFCNHVDGVPNLTEAALAENVKFVQANVFCDHHVVLRGGKPFRWHEGAPKVMQRPIGNQYAACVNGKGIGEILEVARVPYHEVFHFVRTDGIDFTVGDPVDVVFGQAKYFSQFSDYGAVLESAIRTDQGNVWETLKNIGGHIVAIGPRKIDVKVRRVGSVKVDEPLEIKVQFDGVYIRDAQEIGD